MAADKKTPPDVKVVIGPIKSQGIKTKLISWIKEHIARSGVSREKGRFIEPFAGTGVVGFNCEFKRVISNDINPHLVRFYKSIKTGETTPELADKFLTEQAIKMSKEQSGDLYYKIRDRFNKDGDPLDFLFLTRCCFNGLLRFNNSGKFNVSWNKKPDILHNKRYKTLVINQLQRVQTIIHDNHFKFFNKDFRLVIPMAKSKDLLYLDPPYFGRHSDYFTHWTEEDESDLFKLLCETKAKFILSTWHHNEFRSNPMIKKFWNNFNVHTKNHHFQLGANRENRRPMVEALVTNF
jgi:DNA adenine methylase